MKTGVRLVKDEEKVNDFSSYEMNTRKASLPPTSDIEVQTFFSCSFLNRRDKKGIVNKISESAWGCIFHCIFLKRSWIYYLRHKDPKVSYCSNFLSWNHFTHLLITCEFKDIGYFLEKNCGFPEFHFIIRYQQQDCCKFIHLQHNRADVNTQVYREKWERTLTRPSIVSEINPAESKALIMSPSQFSRRKQKTIQTVRVIHCDSHVYTSEKKEDKTKRINEGWPLYNFNWLGRKWKWESIYLQQAILQLCT